MHVRIVARKLRSNIPTNLDLETARRRVLDPACFRHNLCLSIAAKQQLVSRKGGYSCERDKNISPRKNASANVYIPNWAILQSQLQCLNDFWARHLGHSRKRSLLANPTAACPVHSVSPNPNPRPNLKMTPHNPPPISASKKSPHHPNPPVSPPSSHPSPLHTIK